MNRPFFEIIQIIHDIQDFPIDAGHPITYPDILDKLYTVIYQKGVMCDDCKKWDERPDVEKTWTDSQDNFTENLFESRGITCKRHNARGSLHGKQYTVKHSTRVGGG